jgi:hypothetical protein
MKRTPLAVALIMALLFSTIAGAISVNSAKANPAPLFPLPWEPITTPPTIVVQSPIQNQTYNSTKLWLNFSIAVDDKTCFENITSVYYRLDGGERQNIPVHDIDTLFYPSARTLNFSTILNLPSGVYSVEIGVEADSYYVVTPVNWGNPLSSFVVQATSDPVNFVVANPFPVVIVGAVTGILAVVVIAGLLVYFKKRKRVTE